MKASVQISRGVERLFGTRDENMRLIEAGLKVNTHLIDNLLEIEGEADAVSRAANILEEYVALVREGHVFNNGDLNSYLRVVTEDPEVGFRALLRADGSVTSARKCWRRKRSTSAATWKRSSGTTWCSEWVRRAPARPTLR